MRPYAEAFWLTEEASDEGSSGTGGAEDVDVEAVDVEGFAAVGVAAVGAGVAAEAAPGLSHGFGGDAMI